MARSRRATPAGPAPEAVDQQWVDRVTRQSVTTAHMAAQRARSAWLHAVSREREAVALHEAAAALHDNHADLAEHAGNAAQAAEERARAERARERADNARHRLELDGVLVAAPRRDRRRGPPGSEP